MIAVTDRSELDSDEQSKEYDYIFATPRLEELKTYANIFAL